ncbi:hypothetical protein HETIRDRAFT_147771 [Heterobasidion irregulare TC 32-1]|uniref:Uncharacterized protein n=1 Tax=Heterobasidion irregulare (strain TC 32-1) TaxID=747525 RepID=W4K4M8_HETIT|nr:uncharacterized protein HETIRDRAFT_147771 [Heterobasidion irregulare TC 32-1]ETW80295.1 hypothetical protein HETIRDRAFT_147771 [Heterobasidion irregulare TC 32-1]
MDREAAVAGLGLAGGTGPQWRRQGGEQYQRHGSLEGPRGRGMGAGSSPRGAKGQPPKVRRPHTSGGVPGDEASDSSSPAPRATRHHRSHSAAPSGLYGGAYVGSPGSLDRDEPAREADEADLVDGDASDLSATPVQTRSAHTSPASAPPPVLVSSPSSGAPGKLSTAPAISTTTSTTTTTAAGAAAATAPVPALDNDTLRPTPTARMRSRTPDPKRDYAGYGDLGSGRPAPALGLGVDGADGRGDDAGGGVELFRVFTAPQQETYNDLLRASEGDRERPRQNHFSRANKLARMGFVGGELVAGAGAGPGKQGSIGGQGQQQQQQPRSHGHRLGGGLKSLMQTLKGR